MKNKESKTQPFGITVDFLTAEAKANSYRRTDSKALCDLGARLTGLALTRPELFL